MQSEISVSPECVSLIMQIARNCECARRRTPRLPTFKFSHKKKKENAYYTYKRKRKKAQIVCSDLQAESKFEFRIYRRRTNYSLFVLSGHVTRHILHFISSSFYTSPASIFIILLSHRQSSNFFHTLPQNFSLFLVPAFHRISLRRFVIVTINRRREKWIHSPPPFSN